MARISKAPEERREEIIKTSLELFLKTGYDNTSVNDIVESLNIAKGTFYYYFKSKEEIFEVSINHYLDEIMNSIISMLKNKNEPPEKRFEKAINYKFKKATDERQIGVKEIHQIRFREIHNKIVARFNTLIFPAIRDVIIEGCETGIFNVKYPCECSEMIIHTIAGLCHNIEFYHSAEKRLRVKEFVEELLINSLNIKDFNFNIEISMNNIKENFKIEKSYNEK